MVQLYDTLRRLHPSKKYDPEVQQQDMILKILEVLPVSERKFIKIDDPLTNHFFDVLKQILAYCAKETELKLSIEDIKKEQKPKAGTFEVNNTQNTQSVASNSQPQKQQTDKSVAAVDKKDKASGGKYSKNPAHANLRCNFCHNLGHVQKDCMKKSIADSLGIKTKNNGQNSKNGNYNKNFKYNANQNYSQNSGKETRCNYCGLRGHVTSTCRHRQKLEYQNQGAMPDAPFCKYCKRYGHLIGSCKKRIDMEELKGRQQSYGNANASGSTGNAYNSNPRRCYRCQATTHIAKFCPNNNYSTNQNF